MPFLPLYNRYRDLLEEASPPAPTVGGFLVYLSDEELAELAWTSEKLPADELDDAAFDDLVLLTHELAEAENEPLLSPQDVLHMLHQLCVCVTLARLARMGYALTDVAALRLAADDLPETTLTDQAYLLLGAPTGPNSTIH